MKGLSEILFADKIVRMGSMISLLFIFATLGIIAFFYANLPPVAPIYNQMPWGEARLGTKIEIFLPLLLAVTFFVVNLIFGLFVYQKMPLVSRTLSITGLLLLIIAFIFTFRTIQLIY
jgi:hypothetical protein